jgi:hypothetical protein
LGSISGAAAELGQSMSNAAALKVKTDKKGAEADDDEVNKFIGQYNSITDPAERRALLQSSAVAQARFKEHAGLKLAGADARSAMDREYEGIKAAAAPGEFDAAKTQSELNGKYFAAVDHPAYRQGFNQRGAQLDQQGGHQAG